MEPFVGEIRMFTFAWAPRGFALCNGAVLPIQQNMALYSLLSTLYGGDGKANFGLPDLRGRVPLCMGKLNTSGTVYPMGAANAGGAETVPLASTQVPTHTHATNVVTTAGDGPSPTGNVFATVGQTGTNPMTNIYCNTIPPTQLVALAGSTVSNDGGNAPHNNMQPYATLNFCIATMGLYPPRN